MRAASIARDDAISSMLALSDPEEGEQFRI